MGQPGHARSSLATAACSGSTNPSAKLRTDFTLVQNLRRILDSPRQISPVGRLPETRGFSCFEVRFFAGAGG